MKFTLGFSPCPNDTFIFDALVNNKIDTGNFEFDVVLEDVQTLNQWAIQGKLDITKLSYGVLALVLDNYSVLQSGSALGKGVGPLLIAAPNQTSPEGTGLTSSFKHEEYVNNSTIAIPGEQTTAHLLFSLAYPHAKKKMFLRYDAIENFVAEGKGLGVIIHENRFTYEDKGLKKILDLGDFWEKQTGNAIPLGGIVIKRKIDSSNQIKIDSLIKKSIEYGFANYPVLNDYIRTNAQEMSDDVIRKHIDLYVNDYSIHLGDKGKNTIKKLLQVYQQTHRCSIDYNHIFTT
jgi:1,4-dihydroxy-6-naphthoate synthase